MIKTATPAHNDTITSLLRLPGPSLLLTGSEDQVWEDGSSMNTHLIQVHQSFIHVIMPARVIIWLLLMMIPMKHD
jgi:hypothetical protein